MIFVESATAHDFLDGLAGIEIGGSAHNPFNIPGCRNVDYSADVTTIFKQSEFKEAGAPLPVDIVAPGDDLPFADETLDYVLNSHVVEHFWDPIAAITEWLRVLRPGGIVFMIVPHKERTFDADKPRTTLAELIDRHNGTLQMSPDVDPHGHHSIWITEDVVELITYLGLEILRVDDIDDKVGNGFTIVFRKAGDLPPAYPSLDLGCGANKRAKALGIDRCPGPGVDLVLDLNRARLPFDDDTIPNVYSNSLFQFLDDPVAMLVEIVRVCKHGAKVEIFTPHGANDGAMLLGARHRFAEVTWIDVLGRDIFAQSAGNLVLKGIVLYVPPPTVENLRQRNIPLDFAIRHMTNVVSRIGASMVVNKPHGPATQTYPQRVLADPA